MWWSRVKSRLVATLIMCAALVSACKADAPAMDVEIEMFANVNVFIELTSRDNTVFVVKDIVLNRGNVNIPEYQLDAGFGGALGWSGMKGRRLSFGETMRVRIPGQRIVEVEVVTDRGSRVFTFK